MLRNYNIVATCKSRQRKVFSSLLVVCVDKLTWINFRQEAWQYMRRIRIVIFSEYIRCACIYTSWKHSLFLVVVFVLVFFAFVCLFVLKWRRKQSNFAEYKSLWRHAVQHEFISMERCLACSLHTPDYHVNCLRSNVIRCAFFHRWSSSAHTHRRLWRMESFSALAHIKAKFCLFRRTICQLFSKQTQICFSSLFMLLALLWKHFIRKIIGCS